VYINDKYSVDVIMSIINNSVNLIYTPNDYSSEYEDLHGITLSDLRVILEDLFKRGDSCEK
jgi:hypothetical protein